MEILKIVFAKLYKSKNSGQNQFNNRTTVESYQAEKDDLGVVGRDQLATECCFRYTHIHKTYVQFFDKICVGVLVEYLGPQG